MKPNYQISVSNNFSTLPTSPVVNRTFIPCGWEEDLVRILATVPSVIFPVR